MPPPSPAPLVGELVTTALAPPMAWLSVSVQSSTVSDALSVFMIPPPPWPNRLGLVAFAPGPLTASLPLSVELLRVMVAPAPALLIAPPLPRTPVPVLPANTPATLPVKTQSLMVAVEKAEGGSPKALFSMAPPIPALGVAPAAAATASRAPVVSERAAGHRQRAGEVVDAAAKPLASLADRLIALEGRAADGQGGEKVVDATADAAGCRGDGQVVDEVAAEDVTRAPGNNS